MSPQNQTTLNLTDFQLNILREALNKSWLSLSCNDDNISIEGLDLSNEIDAMVKKNKQMDIDLEYNYNLHREVNEEVNEEDFTIEFTDEELKNLPPPPKEFFEEEVKNKLDLLKDKYIQTELNKKRKVEFNDLKINDIVKFDPVSKYDPELFYGVEKITPKFIVFRTVDLEELYNQPSTLLSEGVAYHKLVKINDTFLLDIHYGDKIRKQKANNTCTLYDHSIDIVSQSIYETAHSTN